MKTAIILAAGRGSRLRPLTDTIPKPLVKVHNKPLLQWHLENLADAGFENIIINIDYLGDHIINALQHIAPRNLTIQISDERKCGALESAGGIKKALELFEDETFLVINADIFTTFTLQNLPPLQEKTVAALIMVDNPPHNKEGDFFLTSDPHQQHKYTFSGIGVYHRALFDTIEPMQKIPLAPLLREHLTRNAITTHYYDGKWHDIGTLQRLQEINNETF